MTSTEKEYPKWVEVEGVIEWAKVFAGNRDRQGPNGAYSDWDGATTVDMILDEEEYKKIAASGSGLKGKKQEDGTYRVKFKRRWVHKTSKGEEYPQYGGAPKVIRPDGTPWDLDTDGLIGNGSTGICHFQVYETGKYIGTRLVGLQVRHHVEFESTGGYQYPDLTEEQEEEPKVKTKKLLEDELPF